jgi:5-formyltetrahydrofolate cyclo-ligase
MNKSDLRALLRSRRKRLSEHAQKKHALALIPRVLTWLSPSATPLKIALYQPQDGELSPLFLADWLYQAGHQLYLPILHPHAHNPLRFAPWSPDISPMKTNKFGIKEPLHSAAHRLSAHSLDLIFMPLVGFDAQGSRLGMGGGYYDRSLAFKMRAPHRGPLLIGLAHECQKIDQLPIEDWDVPLDMIQTEKKRYRSKISQKRRRSA